MNLLVAVGSRHDQVCSIGAFARAEARALHPFFKKVEVLQPTADGQYPKLDSLKGFIPDIILFHAPSLHDRKKPWNVLMSALKLKNAFPSADFIPIVHEFSEAPLHWKIRQTLIALMSSGIVVNSEADEAGLSLWKKRILKTTLGPTLEMPKLKDLNPNEMKSAVLSIRTSLAEEFGIDKNKKWVLHPGLLTPGKGLEKLSDLKCLADLGAVLVVIGGLGPKQRDRNFANSSVERLTQKYGNQFHWINSPDDKVFQTWLFGADLVLLPYDAGVSERRSSFLSAMHCGANVATTIGEFSRPLSLDRSAVHILDDVWDASIRSALAEPEDSMIQRRIKNLRWAESRSWNKRMGDLLQFFKTLK
jgi:hypothetical protein